MKANDSLSYPKNECTPSLFVKMPTTTECDQASVTKLKLIPFLISIFQTICMLTQNHSLRSRIDTTATSSNVEHAILHVWMNPEITSELLLIENTFLLRHILIPNIMTSSISCKISVVCSRDQ